MKGTLIQIIHVLYRSYTYFFTYIPVTLMREYEYMYHFCSPVMKPGEAVGMDMSLDYMLNTED